MDELHLKLQKLQDWFKEHGAVAVAFSSGVDSAFMLKVATDVLPQDKVLAITAVSEFFPKRERLEAEEFCKQCNIKHIFLPIDILSIDEVAQNPKNRCYLCKHALFTKIKQLAADNGINVVCEGSNLDDLGDYRPGMKAIAELDIKSPLKIAGLTKQDIRDLSKEIGLKTWDKPSFACLASRFVYGEQITANKLKMVENAEQFLLDLGFKQMRVRLHGNMARIEILPEDFEKITKQNIRNKIYNEFAKLGFAYSTLDLKGFRSGSMNETILKKD
jgi:uncharacterized protein